MQVSGLPPVTLEETKASVGEGVTALIGNILAMKNIRIQDTRELVARVLDYYTAHPVVDTRLYPQVRETLERLGSYKKAVISNKVTSLARAILEALSLIEPFAIIAGSDTLPERKPSPVPLLDVMKQLEIRPEEALMIGDSIVDMTAGRAAGVRTVAVTYGYGKPGFASGADYVIDDFSHLIEVVESL